MFKLTIALILVLSRGIALNDDAVLNQMQQFTDDLEASPVGKMILNLATIHSTLRGPLDDLLSTIQDLQNEIQDNLKKLDQDNIRRSNQYQKNKQTLENAIGTLNFQLSASADQIDNLLVPTIDQVQKRIANVGDNINTNRQNLARETQERKKQKEQFYDAVFEHQSATNAIDEALMLLNGLLNGKVSFTENTSVKNSMELIQMRLPSNNNFSPIIEALIGLAQNYTNQDSLKQIISGLNDLRNQVVDALNELTFQENGKAQSFEDRLQNLQTDFNQMQKQVNDYTYQLVANQNKLKREKAYQETAKADLADLQAQLDQENSSNASETALYQSLRSATLSEFGVATKALEYKIHDRFQFSTFSLFFPTVAGQNKFMI